MLAVVTRNNFTHFVIQKVYCYITVITVAQCHQTIRCIERIKYLASIYKYFSTQITLAQRVNVNVS